MEAQIANALQRLDSGSLSAIFDGAPGRVLQPVVQCVQVKPIPGQDGNPDRFRVVFNDSKNYCQTMLASSANEEYTSGRLKRGCLAQLVGYQANRVKDKKILIITALKVLEEYGVMDKLGDPASLEVKQEDSKGQPGPITSNGFYGNQPQPQPQKQQQQQPQRSMPSHGKSSSSAAHANIYPIEALSPYANKWTIKARCTNKSEVKHWHSRNGEGKLFNVNLLDESGEIKATGFNDQCDQYYDLFQEGSVYYISSPCRVQIAKKQFSNINNDYELTFERETLVEKAEDQDDVPKVKFNFTTISDLQTVEKDTTIDVVGILKEVGETSQITSKTTSKPYDKRELTLVDNSGYSVRLTVWGKTAAGFDTPPDTVVAFKGVKVSDFGGRSLSLLSSGSMTVNPDMEEAHRLKGWYDSQGQNASYATHAGVTSTSAGKGSGSDPAKTIAQVKEENLGLGERTDYFTIKATTQYIKDTFAYAACREQNCNKKVIEEGDGWRCVKCDKTFDKPEYRYIMSVNVSDHTGQMWLNCFDDVGRQIMGMSADELTEIKEEDDKRKTQIFSDANCNQWIWRCRAKTETFQEAQQVRYQVMSIQPMNFTVEAHKLAELIKLYNIDE